MTEHPTSHCDVCKRPFRKSELVPMDSVRPGVAEMIREEHPDAGETPWLCPEDINRYRARYVQKMLEEERGELGRVEKEVVDRLLEQELVSVDVNAAFDRKATFGQRLADRVAEIGGSWAFVIGFFVVLVAWMMVNAWILRNRAFDPYPFILLNLALSCLAAIQAPIIMMSQNRQESKDRLRAEHDYRVNLKAELEVRLLSDRVDRLLSHQWQRLLEIQEIQVELMEQMGVKRKKD